jgi:hypothetical protein
MDQHLVLAFGGTIRMQMTRMLVARPRANRQAVLDAAFFVAVPLVLSLTMAAAGRYVDMLGLQGGMLYVAALSFVPWWIAGLTTELAFVLLRRFAPPLWVVTTFGVVLSAPFVTLYVHEINHWFHTSWSGGHLLRELAWPASVADPLDRIRDILLGTGRAIVLWTAFVIAFVSTFGWARYQRGAKAVSAATGKGLPRAPNRLQNSGSNWSRADDASLIAMVNANTPLKSIAARMERTVPAIRGRMAKLKLRFPEA